jgi:hypothetical protein
MPENKHEDSDQTSVPENVDASTTDQDEMSEEELDSASGGVLTPPQRNARNKLKSSISSKAQQVMGISIEN